MFNDVGFFEVLTVVVLGVLVFGPDKLPKMIQDGMRVLRKIREFTDSAKNDIRSELGPEFKDFEFEDLHPKNFVRKQLAKGEDEYGLSEIRSSLDFRKEMNELADTVHGRDVEDDEEIAKDQRSLTDLSKKSEPDNTAGLGARPAKADLTKRPEPAAATPPPYDIDAT
ncbi:MULTISPECIES: sec-independent translocase [Streptomyces]|uniref:Sec-independent protein translocase protein TatB n=1 Tax=Streptomyces evansiae TaxID=3075535 RepID=A0ABU2R0L5_9ACTN|nr:MULTISPECIES: sec-independent translocase [unclassified Streptomyces]MYQ58889.1 Sec-independent protein translocase TatB [Streptomyces sp. SID4926]EFL02475.1 sec-independent translocase [Streptomyces sp. SPB78]MDT0410248.1 sec-independent translocase [Streptomyces sp. DSM 41979]MDT0423745.1 sec-independent translocase [Streptomyces sp. DSM 41859]WEH29670.1 sec-independent translocase [Streptomyces sp. AM 3-1-1]